MRNGHREETKNGKFEKRYFGTLQEKSVLLTSTKTGEH